MSTLSELEAQRKALELEIRAVKDAEFCTPSSVREALTVLARETGGFGMEELDKLELEDLYLKLRKEVRRLHDSYQSSLWPKDRRGC